MSATPSPLRSSSLRPSASRSCRRTRRSRSRGPCARSATTRAELLEQLAPGAHLTDRYDSYRAAVVREQHHRVALSVRVRELRVGDLLRTLPALERQGA